jgi:hypothetical protein
MRYGSYLPWLLVVAAPALLGAKGCHFGSDDVSLGTDAGAAGEDGGPQGSGGEDPASGGTSTGHAGRGGNAPGTGGTVSAAGTGSDPGSGGTSTPGSGGTSTPGSGGTTAPGSGGTGTAGTGTSGTGAGGGNGDLPSYLVCGLPIDDGSDECVLLLPGVSRYGFNAQTLECEEFTLYCEAGNENQFETREACEAACSSDISVPPTGFASSGEPAACAVPPSTGWCEAAFPRFFFDPRTRRCEPYTYGGCEGTTNNFISSAECEAACTPGNRMAHPLVEASSCTGFGIQVTDAESAESFELAGSVLSREEFWGCGCATRAEWVMAYTATSPVELRLCHDDGADGCEAACSGTLEWDLEPLLERAGTDEFVFVD